MKKIVFSILPLMFVIQLQAQKLFNRSYSFPVTNLKAEIYLNPNFLPINIDKVTILNGTVNGTSTIDSNNMLVYNATSINTKDSCKLEIAYTDTFKVKIKDTIKVFLTTMGKANTISNFYSMGKILKKEFYASVYSDSLITSYAWDFGDANTSTLENPVHTYLNAGVYNVCLTASTNVDANTFCQKVLVNDTNYIELVEDYIVSLYPDTLKEFKVLENDFFYNATKTIVKNGKYHFAEFKNNSFYLKGTKLVPKEYDTIMYSICKNGNCDTATVYCYQFITLGLKE